LIKFKNKDFYIIYLGWTKDSIYLYECYWCWLVIEWSTINWRNQSNGTCATLIRYYSYFFFQYIFMDCTDRNSFISLERYFFFQMYLTKKNTKAWSSRNKIIYIYPEFDIHQKRKNWLRSKILYDMNVKFKLIIINLRRC